MRPCNLPGSQTNTAALLPKDFWKVHPNSKNVPETLVKDAVILQSSPDISPLLKEEETNSHLAESFPCPHADCVQSINSTFAHVAGPLGAKVYF